MNENGASENSVSEETVKVEAVGSPENGEETTERTTPPDSDEPTQYVPMANYRDSSERGDSSDQARTGGADGQRSDSADSPETSEEKAVIQAFWFAVPEPREAVDAKTGMPVFTIYPGDWFLALEDKARPSRSATPTARKACCATSTASSAADSCAEPVDAAAS